MLFYSIEGHFVRFCFQLTSHDSSSIVRVHSIRRPNQNEANLQPLLFVKKIELLLKSEGVEKWSLFLWLLSFCFVLGETKLNWVFNEVFFFCFFSRFGFIMEQCRGRVSPTPSTHSHHSLHSGNSGTVNTVPRKWLLSLLYFLLWLFKYNHLEVARKEQ
jgi:hypothetical protein